MISQSHAVLWVGAVAETVLFNRLWRGIGGVLELGGGNWYLHLLREIIAHRNEQGGEMVLPRYSGVRPTIRTIKENLTEGEVIT